MQLLLKIMCWSSYQTRRTLVSLFSDISLHGRDIRYCDIFLRWWPACISLVWVCPRVPRCIKGFERTKYMCFCPQIEPVKVASVLEKSFKNFHDKHGIGEAELKWPSRVRKPELEKTTSGALPSFQEVWPPWGEGALEGPCRSLSNNMTVIWRTNWQERRRKLSFRMSDLQRWQPKPAPASPSPPPTYWLSPSNSIGFRPCRADRGRKIQNWLSLPWTVCLNTTWDYTELNDI